MKPVVICILADNTDTCIGPECPMFGKCWPDIMPCPKCLKDILDPLPAEAEGDWRCSDCEAVFYDSEDGAGVYRAAIG